VGQPHTHLQVTGDCKVWSMGNAAALVACACSKCINTFRVYSRLWVEVFYSILGQLTCATICTLFYILADKTRTVEWRDGLGVGF
jgi:hypothetical protein